MEGLLPYLAQHGLFLNLLESMESMPSPIFTAGFRQSLIRGKASFWSAAPRRFRFLCRRSDPTVRFSLGSGEESLLFLFSAFLFNLFFIIKLFIEFVNKNFAR
jgi:hypothetical protein